MSDLNLGKIKVLYGDMVAMEINIANTEKRLAGKLSEFEAKLQKPYPKFSQKKSAINSLKTIIMVAASSLSVGLVIRPGEPISYWIAGLPFGMTIAWFIFDYLKCDEIAENQRLVVNSVEKLPTQVPVKVWTEDEFVRVSLSLNRSMSDRTLSACLDVLVNNMEVNEAAKIHNTMTNQISRCLFMLRSTKI